MLHRDVTKIGGESASRKIGTAPNLGKVLRSPQSGVKRKKSASERGKRKKKQRFIMAWSIILTVVSLIVVMGFVVSHFLNQASPPKKSSTSLATATPDLDSIFAQDSPSEDFGEKASLELLKTGLYTNDPAELLKSFHLAQGETAQTALGILDKIKDQGELIAGSKWIGTNFANGKILEQVVVNLENDERITNRLAQIFPDENGVWKIDFDSYVRRSHPDWETILTGASPKSIVRIFATNDTYYNGVFADDSIWRCYTLVSPDAYKVLYAYAKKDSAQYRAMEKILSTEIDLHRATLEISKIPESGERQFEISRVLAEDWVLSDKKFDESF